MTASEPLRWTAVVALGVAVTLAGCGAETGATDGAADSEELRWSGITAGDLDTLATGLDVPWAIDVAPDGRVFVTERTGRIRVIQDGELRAEPWAELDVVPPSFRSEGGLLGLALGPDFGETGHVYVVGTFYTGERLENRVVRFTERDGRGVGDTVIVDGLPGPETGPETERAIHTHVGGALTFGPDGALYVTTGDATYPERAQDTASFAGKVLRYRPDGSVPADNPLPGSPVYALGVRNPQGLAWLPDGGLAATEHGPSELSWESYSGWFGDELNVLRPGGNYGWPRVAGSDTTGAYLPPLVEWSPSIAPAGLVAYPRSDSSVELLVASLRNQHVRVVKVKRRDEAPVGWTATGSREVLEGTVGRIRALAVGPDGSLYFSSSNRDGRGQPGPGDDRVFRFTPPG